MAHIFDSDSDDSEFSGFGSSDIDLPVDESDDSDVSFSDNDTPVVISDDATWTQDLSPIVMREFTEQSGPQLEGKVDRATGTPLDYFFILFPLALLQLLVVHTNAYATFCMARDGPDSSWAEVTETEMRAFLGINILMGIVQMPTTDMYWSSDMFFGLRGVQMTMTRNRYCKILRYFHASDRSLEPPRGSDTYDRLFKIRQVIDTLLQTFRNSYVLSRDVAVDEAMIGYTGRLSFRQYMPAKPIKRGIKCWMLCDSRSGYLANFEVYLGRDGSNVEHGLAYNVVMRLTRFIRNTFRWVFFDNFFTGLPLVKSLLQNGLYSCGTVRCNRKGFPQQLKKPAALRQRGDSQVLQLGDSNITASVWMDRKPVHHFSSLSDPTEICDATRRSGQNILHLQQPHSVSAYNRSMGGVDLHDQLRAKYPSGRNSKKWWRYLFWFLLDSAIVNSYVLYKEWSTRETKKRRYTHLDFRRELLKELIGGYRKRKHSDRDDAVDRPALMPVENIIGHKNVRLNAKRTTCKYHKTRVGHRSDTVYGCEVCNVHLCKECHVAYHQAV